MRWGKWQSSVSESDLESTYPPRRRRLQSVSVCQNLVYTRWKPISALYVKYSFYIHDGSASCWGEENIIIMCELCKWFYFLFFLVRFVCVRLCR